MSLQAKILLIVFAVVSLYAAVDYASQYIFVLPSFISLEQAEAQNSMRLCVGSLKREITGLGGLAENWGMWGHSYQRSDGKTAPGVSENLDEDPFMRETLDFVYICDANGRAIWGRTIDRTNRRDDLFGQLWSTIYYPSNKAKTFVSGIVITGSGPVLMASRPVTGKDDQPNGETIIVGEFLDDDLVMMLAGQQCTNLRVWSADSTFVSNSQTNAVKHLKTKSPFYMDELSEKSFEVYTLFSDIRGKPSILMRAEIARDISAKGIAAIIRSNLFSNLTAGLFVLLILFVLLRYTVIGPLRKLTRYAITIGRSDNISTRLTMDRSDEIGTLAREFEGMVERLAQTRKKLIEQSYQTGMSEMASGVLHNVRNMLTPMVSRIDSLRQRLSEAPIGRIRQAQAELARQGHSAEHKKDLDNFVNLAYESLVGVVEETKQKLDGLTSHIVQIERMLFEQSKYSRMEMFTEKVSLDKLLSDATDLMPNKFREKVSIKLDQNIESIEPVTTCSIALLQVFNNLLINSAEAVGRVGTADGMIQISAQEECADGASVIHVQICDNGEGIETGQLDRVFQRGYSTKETPSGIGLDWCTNTIAKMNGRIYVESEGKGKGACFHVLFPASDETSRTYEQAVEVKL